MRTNFLTVCAIPMAQTVFFAQDSTGLLIQRSCTTKSLNETPSPEMDGLVDDIGWGLVAWEGDFIEQRPDVNTLTDHQTKIKIVFDQKFLYVGIRAYDSDPDKVEIRLSRRDGFQ